MTEEKKMRYSKQREMIYEYLLSTGEHPSAEIIYEELKKTIPALSLGTVYRNLKVLEELGMIRKISGSGNTERYDPHVGDHSHFLCTECGALHDISFTDPAAVYGSVVLEPGYHMADFSLTIKGLCPKCAEKKDSL